MMRNPTEAGTPKGGEAGLNANAGVMPGLESAYKEGGRRASGVIVTSELPPHLTKILAVFDQDGDGNLDLDEIAEAARVYQATKNSAKMYKKVAIALFALLCTYTAALGGMIFAIVDANKDVEAKSGTLIDRSTGEATKTDIGWKFDDEYTYLNKVLNARANPDFLGRVYGSTLGYKIKTSDGNLIDERSPVNVLKFLDKEEGARVLIGFQSGKAYVYEAGYKALLIDLNEHQNDWHTLALEDSKKRQLCAGCPKLLRTEYSVSSAGHYIYWYGNFAAGPCQDDFYNTFRRNWPGPKDGKCCVRGKDYLCAGPNSGCVMR